MPDVQLTDITLQGGVFEARMLGGAPDTVIEVWAKAQQIGTADCVADGTQILLRWAVPADLLGLGVQTVVFSTPGGAPLYTLVLRAGAPVEGDLAEEVALLRAELDLLKSAFRRHCAETDPDL